MPARSVIIFVLNTTDRALNLVVQSQHLDHGEWSSGGMPPTTIPQGGFGHFGSESDGFLTGTQGSVSYTVSGESDDHQATFYWDNPYIGGNSYSATAPPGYVGRPTGSDGDNSIVTFMFMRSKLILHVSI